METIAGIFASRSDAERVIGELRSIGVPQDHISLAMPGTTPGELESTVTTSDTEQPGVGSAIGAVVGGAAGAAAGPLGAAAVSLLIPGIGPIVAIGLAASAIFGIGGAIAGAKAGNAIEGSIPGIPRDEIFLYEDALRNGRTLLVVTTEDDLADTARQAIERGGAESVDAARERWWTGMRSAEEEVYRASGGDFASDEESYRRGFEAALHGDIRTRTDEQTAEFLHAHYPQLADNAAFRKGFERGRIYYKGMNTVGNVG
jgi:hypothetical protein